MSELSYPSIIIHAKKVASIKRKHPWVFSGAIKKIEGQPKDGDVVNVYAPNKEFLAIGHYQAKRSISVRLLSFSQQPIDDNFWFSQLQSAYHYRSQLGIVPATAQNNVYRLVNAEGDGLPGLIIDVYKDTAVFQAHSWGMYQAKEAITKALVKLYGNQLQAVYDKSSETLNYAKQRGVKNGYLWGKREAISVTENGHQFWVNWEQGQKTGFFIDQRNNRALLGRYAKGKTVLNAFCYSGGFSVYALQQGAKLVHSVDASKKAIGWTNKNVNLNLEPDNAAARHQAYESDVLKFLQQSTTIYDLMILDPPAYAKSLKAKHNAIQGYKRLNAKAIQLIKSNGILFTFSCSGIITAQLFEDTIRAAAIEAKRHIRIVQRIGQSEDHPVNIFHPEGNYLKGLVLYIV